MIQITCITKPGGHYNSHEAIKALGWTEDGTGKSGIASREKMYEWLENNIVAYVSDYNGNKAYLYTKISPSGTKYVQTKADGQWSNNLLSLMECIGK